MISPSVSKSLLLENVKDVIVVVDEQGCIIEFNRAAEEHFLYSKAEVLGSHVRLLFDNSEVCHFDCNEINRLGTIMYEWRNRRKDGTVFWSLCYCSTILDIKGAVIGYLGVFRDVSTDRRLEASQNILDRVVQYMHQPLVVCNKHGLIEFLNPAFETLSNYSAADLVGRDIEAVIPEIHESKLNLTLLSRLLNGEVVTEQFTGRPKQGTFFSYALTGLPVKDKNNVLTHSIFIWEKTGSEYENETNARNIDAVVNLMDKVVYIIDVSGRVCYWSDAAAKMYGWKKETAQGIHIKHLLFSGLSVADSDTIIYQALQNDMWKGEISVAHKEGHMLAIETRWQVLNDFYGQKKCILILDENITEKRANQWKAQRYERLNSLGTLASGIAHDLNNVLTPIMISAQSLHQTISEPKQIKSIELIESSTQRARSLIHQILKLGRDHKAEKKLLHVPELLHETARIVFETFPKNIELALNIPFDLWPIHGDATQINQVLLNLCINARDAMPSGGCIIMIAENLLLHETQRIGEFKLSPGYYVKFTVEDNGHGISPENIEKIFDPFFSTKPNGMGTGLGLANVLTIVNEYRGAVSVESLPHTSTKFCVTLPASLSNQNAFSMPSRPSHQTTYDLGLSRVLIIDDEPMIVDSLKAGFEKNNIQVTAFTNANQFIQIWDTLKFDGQLALLDIDMPYINGYTLASIIKKRLPHCRIMLMSGSQNAIASVPGITAIQKPFSLDDLFQKIQLTGNTN